MDGFSRTLKLRDSLYPRGGFYHDGAARLKHLAQNDSVGLVVIHHQHLDALEIDRVDLRMNSLGGMRLNLKFRVETKLAAASGCTFHGDVTPHQTDQPSNDRETEPGPAIFSRRRG